MPTKTRTTAMGTRQYRNSDNVLISTSSLQKTHEYITYTNSAPGQPFRQNPCTHYRSLPRSGHARSKTSPYYFTYTNHVGKPDHPGTFAAQLVFDEGVAEPKSDGSGMSIVNTLLELDQTIAMFAGGLAKTLFSMLDWPKYVNSQAKVRRRIPVSGINDSYLTYTYGIIPLYQDCLNFIVAIHNIANSIENSAFDPYARKVHFAQSAKYHKTFTGLQTTSDPSFRWEYTGYLSYAGTLLPHSILPKEIAYILRQFGLDLDLAILWNAIPYSFVLEMIFPWIQGLLSDISPLLAGLRWTFSGSYSRHIEGVQYFGDSPALAISVRYYQRIITTQKVKKSDFSFEFPSARQALNVLSLILQRSPLHAR